MSGSYREGAEVVPSVIARRTAWLNVLVLVCFALITIVARQPGHGYDLTSSYLGCRLFANGQVTGDASHLYGQSATDYDYVDDSVWHAATIGRGFPPGTLVPPYVQTPLWGYALQPLCRTTSWPVFNEIFVVLVAFSFAAMLWLTARFWAPHLFTPWWLVLVCLLVPLEPFRYSLILTQTHVLFILMALLAVLWARQGHPVAAGVLLAVAAAIKITPGLLVIYWLITRQYRALISCAITSVGLMAVTVLLTGRGTVAAWLHSMSRVSNILLVAWNNQSFAAWALDGRYPAAEQDHWHILPLPLSIKAASYVFLIASAVLGGYFDRRMHARRPGQPPYGAILTLVGATIFTPIAWTHYFVLLIVPVMFLLDAHLRRRSPLFIALAGLIVLLNLYRYVWVIAPRAGVHLPLFVRPQFYAGMLALTALGLLYRRAMGNGVAQTATRV